MAKLSDIPGVDVSVRPWNSGSHRYDKVCTIHIPCIDMRRDWMVGTGLELENCHDYRDLLRWLESQLCHYISNRIRNDQTPRV